MIIIVAAALAASQPAAVQAGPAPAPPSQMDHAGPKMEGCCCCKDKMGKEHASHDMDRMPDHQDHAGR